MSKEIKTSTDVKPAEYDSIPAVETKGPSSTAIQFESPIPDAPAEIDETELYPFPDYDVETIPRLKTDYRHMFKPGVDETPYHITWGRTKDLEQCERRYFRVVRESTHGDMFDKKFFNAAGLIQVGPTVENKPELTLIIRPIAAERAERAAIRKAYESFEADPMSHARGQQHAENMERLMHETQGNVQFITTAVAGTIPHVRSGWGGLGKK